MAEFSEFSHVFLNLPLQILGNSLVCEELINEILGLGVLLFKLTEAQILHIKKKKKKSWWKVISTTQKFPFVCKHNSPSPTQYTLNTLSISVNLPYTLQGTDYCIYRFFFHCCLWSSLLQGSTKDFSWQTYTVHNPMVYLLYMWLRAHLPKGKVKQRPLLLQGFDAWQKPDLTQCFPLYEHLILPIPPSTMPCFHLLLHSLLAPGAAAQPGTATNSGVVWLAPGCQEGSGFIPKRAHLVSGV